MSYKGAMSLLRNNKDSNEDYSKRLHEILRYMTKDRLYRWEKSFLDSQINIGYSSLNNMFETVKIPDFRFDYNDDENSLLFNIEIYTVLLLNDPDIIVDYRDKQYIYIFIKITKNACSSLGYELIVESDKSVKIVKNNNLAVGDVEVKNIVHSYYDYHNLVSLEHKREALRELSNLLEPYRGNNPLFYKLEEYVFQVFNTYNIRHNNNAGSRKHNLDVDSLTEANYYEIYDMTFNVAISLYGYYK